MGYVWAILMFMDYSINKRIKELREKIGLNQREFSNLLSLSGGYIAGVEVNLRKVNDRLIKLIVSQFGVNEDWLRSGNGLMFTKKKADEKAVRILSLFNDLPPHFQDVVLGTIELLRKAKETEKNIKTKKKIFP
ncbi:MAG: helix-turn-helix domain-containing protein [Treponema sp.]|jgi:transcriptional regulator with XRE-family HTH domain|nr:helix-turn-helix domain-containing protein [Treponema sp.]